jgi:uncharacterized protein YneF (UPF0154 family)
MIATAALFLGILIGYMIGRKPVKADIGKYSEYDHERR